MSRSRLKDLGVQKPATRRLAGACQTRVARSEPRLWRRPTLAACAGLLGVLLSVQHLQAALPGDDTTTITSDNLEIVGHGARTIFQGHVILTHIPYVLNSDRMVQFKASGIVEAEGHVACVWLQPSGEKIVARGGEARYNPSNQTTELWQGTPELTRWETARDTAPVVVTARRFIAHHEERVLLAEDDVHIQKGTSFSTQSDEAKYVDADQAIYLRGSQQARIDWQDPQGTGHFLSGRAVLFLSPRLIRLEDHVKGRMAPHTQ